MENSADAIVVRGTDLARQIQAQIMTAVTALTKRVGRAPGLGVVLVGENPASKTYVANKEKAAVGCGLATFDYRLTGDISKEALSVVIAEANQRNEIDGILLQLPLPEPLDGNSFVRQILPEKDADGLHPMSQGLLLQGSAQLLPCTPLGSMLLLDEALRQCEPSRMRNGRADLSGLTAVVIGRSILVGKPVALMLMERNATVTVTHSKSPDIAALVAGADIVVAAIGKPHFVKGSWIKPGAIVIDVGINRTSDGKLVGDVAYAEALTVARAITPVPGGVGPMTVTMLIRNTVIAFCLRNGIPPPAGL